ncbi:hypothetical protein DGWBC_1085 [Dehalogenimonas sp. WBC-2]|nr:hypothetical protein DGWBC_1085 [Dehalogenimonas sp. WBC-2]
MEMPPPSAFHQRVSFCPSCGKGLSAPFDYCPSCGVDLSNVREAKQPEMIAAPPSAPGEVAASKTARSPLPARSVNEERQIITDPKLKKLYKQWAVHSDLPEDALPIMEHPRHVTQAFVPPEKVASSFQLSAFLAGIPPVYLFIAGTVFVALILILAIVIAL